MARPPEGDWLGTPYLRFERSGADAVLTVDRPEARMQVKQIISQSYGQYDRMTMDASVRGGEALEGWEAFRDRRSPEWVPQELRTGRP